MCPRPPHDHYGGLGGPELGGSGGRGGRERGGGGKTCFQLAFLSHLLNGLEGWRRGFVSAQVRERPRDVTQVRDLRGHEGEGERERGGSENGGRERGREMPAVTHTHTHTVPTPVVLVMRAMRGCMMPHLTVKSRHSAPFPAMLPSAHTAWSITLVCSEERRRTKYGTAPGQRVEWNRNCYGLGLGWGALFMEILVKLLDNSGQWMTSC